MAERGVNVDHATLNWWVVRYSPQIADQAQKRKRPTLGSWRVDETYMAQSARSCDFGQVEERRLNVGVHQDRSSPPIS